MGRRVFALFWLLLGAFLIYSSLGSFEKQTVLLCDFQAQGGSAALLSPSGTHPVEKLHTNGRIADGKVDGLYGYEGRATWLEGGKPHEDAVWGSIFLKDDGSVEALALWVSDVAYGDSKLSIATLNRDGILDYSGSTAFLFTDKNDKLSHPATFKCRADRNYDHIYQQMASFNWLAVAAFIAIVFLVIFVARRKAESMTFGRDELRP